MAGSRNRVVRIAQPRNSARLGSARLSYFLIDELVKAARASLYLETACDLCGVSRSTVISWMKEGRELVQRIENGQFVDYRMPVRFALLVDLYVELTEVLAESEVDDVKRLAALAELGDFRAIKFRLERRNPQRWGKTEQLMINQGNQGVEPRIVDYKEEISESDEFKLLEEGDKDDFVDPDLEIEGEVIEDAEVVEGDEDAPSE